MGMRRKIGFRELKPQQMSDDADITLQVLRGSKKHGPVLIRVWGEYVHQKKNPDRSEREDMNRRLTRD